MSFPVSLLSFFLSRFFLLPRAWRYCLLANGILLLVFFPAPTFAQDNGYYYTGVSTTSPRNISAGAGFILHNKPTCKSTDYCHVVTWTTFWDTDGSGQFLEAGVLWVKGWKKVGLFYATKQNPFGVLVAWVPFGTYVNTGISKQPGSDSATVWWQWEGGYKERHIRVPGWWDNDGVHPTKFEAYADSFEQRPQNISVSVWPWSIGALDKQAYLQQTYPYLLAPESSFHYFYVRDHK